MTRSARYIDRGEIISGVEEGEEVEPRDVGRMPGTARIWRGGGDDVVAMGLLLDGRWYVERRDASGSGCRAYATRRSALEAAETVMSRGAGDWTEDR